MDGTSWKAFTIQVAPGPKSRPVSSCVFRTSSGLEETFTPLSGRWSLQSSQGHTSGSDPHSATSVT